MKTKFIIFSLPTFFLFACGNFEAQINPNQDEYFNPDQNSSQGYANHGQSMIQSNDHKSNGEQVVMHNMMDNKTGTPFAQIPLPNSWKINGYASKGTPAITGPGGVEIFYFPYQSHVFSNDGMMQQAYQQSGQQMRRPAGIEQILNTEVAQYARQQGLQPIKNYGLQQVAQNDASYANALYSIGQKQSLHLAAGSDWSDQNGNKVMIVVHYNENNAAGLIAWGYYFQMLKAPGASFDQAKNYFINGLGNVQYNQQQIQAYNQAESGRLQQNNAQFQDRMKQQQNNFDRQQANYRATQESINQSSMDAYNARMGSMDRNQRNFTNYIKDESTVNNTTNGQNYQVESGANQYWMNSNGEYIPSNDPNFDPNTQLENTSYGDWEVAPEVK